MGFPLNGGYNISPTNWEMGIILIISTHNSWMCLIIIAIKPMWLLGLEPGGGIFASFVWALEHAGWEFIIIMSVLLFLIAHFVLRSAITCSLMFGFLFYNNCFNVHNSELWTSHENQGHFMIPVLLLVVFLVLGYSGYCSSRMNRITHGFQIPRRHYGRWRTRDYIMYILPERKCEFLSKKNNNKTSTHHPCSRQ